MNAVVVILVVLTFLVLIAGIIFMAIGGKANAKMSNKLMVMRVVMQALAILAVVVFSAVMAIAH